MQTGTNCHEEEDEVRGTTERGSDPCGTDNAEKLDLFLDSSLDSSSHPVPKNGNNNTNEELEKRVVRQEKWFENDNNKEVLFAPSKKSLSNA